MKTINLGILKLLRFIFVQEKFLNDGKFKFLVRLLDWLRESCRHRFFQLTITSNNLIVWAF